MGKYGTAYLVCDRICSQMGEELLQFRNSDGDFVTGFFRREKIRERENLENDEVRETIREINFEVYVLAESGDKVTIQLPRNYCDIFVGGKRHDVNRDLITY